MKAARETLALEEEEGGANEEKGLKVGTTSVEVDSTRGCFATRCVSLLRIDSLLMALVVPKPSGTSCVGIWASNLFVSGYP